MYVGGDKNNSNYAELWLKVELCIWRFVNCYILKTPPFSALFSLAIICEISTKTEDYKNIAPPFITPSFLCN